MIKTGILKDLCTKITDGSHNPPKGVEKGMMMLSSQNVYDDGLNFSNARYLEVKDFEKENKRTDIQVGDVLLTIVGTIGRALVVKSSHPKFTLQRSVAVLKPKHTLLNSNYLSYCLKSPDIQRVLLEGAKGVAQKGIYLNDIRKISIPLPSLQTQKKIAEILDTADSLRQKDKALIEKYNQLSQSLFLEMFGDIETNSKNWKTTTLGDSLDLITYGLTVRPEYINDGIPLISAREIKSGKIDFDSCPKISLDDFKTLSAKAKPQKGDILFSKTGSIGHCSIVEDSVDFAITQNAARLSFKSNINKYYALYFLKSDFFQRLSKGSAKGNAVKDLQLGDMKKFNFLHPPFELQEKFFKSITNIEIQKQLAEKSYENSEALFNSLLQKAFKRELVKDVPEIKTTKKQSVVA